MAQVSLFRRLTASTHHLDAAELRSQVAKLSCKPIGDVERGDRVTLTGRLRAVSYTPREHVPTFEAELFDGTAALALVWLGRRRIPGIEPGRKVVVSGRVGVYEGHPAIYNPRYHLVGTAT